MTPQEIKFLQRLIADTNIEAATMAGEPWRRNASQVAALMADRYSVGLRIGRHCEYQTADIERARVLLAVRGIPELSEDAARDRASVSAIPGISEKSGSQTPHSGEVAVLALTPGCRLGGELLSNRQPGYLVMHHGEAARIEVEALLVVENFETFVQLRRYRWIFRHEIASKAVLAVFRGDTLFKGDSVLRLLEGKTEPVWTFPDFDPAGLGWSLGMPRLAGLVFPWEHMEAKLRELRRSDLYATQLPQWQRIVAGASHPDVQRAWLIINRQWRGLNQEALRDL